MPNAAVYVSGKIGSEGNACFPPIPELLKIWTREGLWLADMSNASNARESSRPLWARNEKAIVTDKLMIQGNLLRWEGYVIQIANISSITKETLVTVKPPTLWERVFGWIIMNFGKLIMFCGCLVVLLGAYGWITYLDSNMPDMMKLSAFAILLGLIVILAGCMIQYFWNKRKPKIKKTRYLNILTNSSRTYCLRFPTKEFRDLVFNFFSMLFLENDKSGNNYYIDNSKTEIIDKSTGLVVDQRQINSMVNSIINSNIGGSNTQTTSHNKSGR